MWRLQKKEQPLLLNGEVLLKILQRWDDIVHDEIETLLS